jgi:hypothetical protein
MHAAPVGPRLDNGASCFPLATIFDWFCRDVSQFVGPIELAPLLCQQLASSRLESGGWCLWSMQALPQIRRRRPTPEQAEKIRTHRGVSRWSHCIFQRWLSAPSALRASVQRSRPGRHSLTPTNRRSYEKIST